MRTCLTTDAVTSIEVDADERVWVFPASAEFPLIYREAMEVSWCAARRALHSPVPRGWSIARWLQQILQAARRDGVELQVTSSTRIIGASPGELGLDAPSPRGQAC